MSEGLTAVKVMEQLGLRERKKLKTRLALIDAGLDLFLTQGFDHTTVEQIAAVVEVSPRTFFRYFSGKEDLALHFSADVAEAITAALAERPAAEPPFSALINAYRTAMRHVATATEEEVQRYLKTRQVLEATPALMERAIGETATLERTLADLVARRRGDGGEPDQRAYLMVAVVTAAARVGVECPKTAVDDVRELVTRIEASLDLAEQAIRPDWDTP
jgi:AcrR family transcriptional regulator